MHMADALISPAVGGVMWAATAGIAAYSIKKIQSDLDDKKIPLMGVMGAFIFAAQMINFSIPGTGSSGHLGGGLILAILLGPYAGFLTMASVLLVQALFFADGGLLAFGCNVFNLGFFPCFIAYPFIYKIILNKGYTSGRILFGAMLAAILGLQMGAFGVVLETVSSGISELPFRSFVMLMQPIHLAIGVVEGLVTAAVVTFVWQARPEILQKTAMGQALGNLSIRKVITGLAIVALLTGGALSWTASTYPDGLEWSMARTAGVEELELPQGLHQVMAAFQEKTAFLPDYSFRSAESEEETEPAAAEAPWPAVSAGTSVSGLVGGSLTLMLAAATGIIISVFKRKEKLATINKA